LVVEGVYDKARPNNSHGFTALGSIEWSKSQKIKRKAGRRSSFF
jgi:hypothetical protein